MDRCLRPPNEQAMPNTAALCVSPYDPIARCPLECRLVSKEGGEGAPDPVTLSDFNSAKSVLVMQLLRQNSAFWDALCLSSILPVSPVTHTVMHAVVTPVT